MAFPRLPDWLIYLAVAAAVLAVAVARHEKAEAPEPPPPVPGAEAAPLPASLPFDRAHVIELPANARTIGTAFSVSDDGIWATSAEVARACRRPVIGIAPGRGVEAGVQVLDEGPVAILATVGGSPAIDVAGRAAPAGGERAFVPGFPKGGPGEAAVRLIGRTEDGGEPVLAWAESGRTEGLGGSLAGMSGAPVIDEKGRAVGVMLSDRPRRGTHYTSSPEALALAVAKARPGPQRIPPKDMVTVDNYYRVADALRRELSVAPVKCLRR